MQEESAESIVPAQIPGKKNIESWFERAGKARRNKRRESYRVYYIFALKMECMFRH
jgi:hypothetical protein